jgi:hypothetical protein
MGNLFFSNWKKKLDNHSNIVYENKNFLKKEKLHLFSKKNFNLHRYFINPLAKSILKKYIYL